MKILRKSFHLLSASKSKFTSLFSAVRDACRCTPSDLKGHNKLKLLVSRELERAAYYSRLSLSTDRHNDLRYPNTRRTYYFRPRASCQALALAHKNMSAALWNPTTDEVKTLPESSVSRPPLVKSMCIGPHGFGFDSESQDYGFGFDSESQDYKVIRFLKFGFKVEPVIKVEPDVKVELYSLKTDSWKEITYPHRGAIPKRPSIHINGVYYYCASFAGKADIILSFDFANEKFSPAHIPAPETTDEFAFAEFHGSLAALVYNIKHQYVNRPFAFEIRAWNGEVWVEVSKFGGIPVVVEKVLGLFDNDKLYLQDTNGRVLLFDCATSELKRLGLKADRGMVFLFPYVESCAKIRIGFFSRSLQMVEKLLIRSWK